MNHFSAQCFGIHFRQANNGGGQPTVHRFKRRAFPVRGDVSGKVANLVLKYCIVGKTRDTYQESCQNKVEVACGGHIHCAYHGFNLSPFFYYRDIIVLTNAFDKHAAKVPKA